MHAKRIGIALCCSWVLLVMGCSEEGALQKIITSFHMQSYEQAQDDWISATAEIDVGAFQMPAFSVPITDPTHPSVSYGYLSFTPGMCGNTFCTGKGDLTVSVNITQASGLDPAGALLPNGTPLPLSGLEGAHVIGIPVANTGARIYLALGQNTAVMGAAIPFSALDPAGQIVPGVNVFIPFSFSGVSLSAGMFFGADTNTTGVGLFINISDLISGMRLHPRSWHAMQSMESKALKFRRLIPHEDDRGRIEGNMRRLHDKKTQLRLQ